MTEQDVAELRAQIKAKDSFEPHFAIKIALLLLSELVLAIYHIGKRLV